MDRNEFKPLLNNPVDAGLLDLCLKSPDAPYIFRSDSGAYENFCDEFVSKLDIERGDVRIVGSARHGFSPKPGKNFSLFTDKSDIDVVVVNEELFQKVWTALLEAVYPRGENLSKVGGWISRTRLSVYTGWIVPKDIKIESKIWGPKARAVLDFKQKWFDAEKLAGQHSPSGFESLNARLYATWRHAELYHTHSLEMLRKSIQL